MAGSVNKVILIGNLGRDPEVRTFQNGGRVANLSVATSESWKDRNTGARREKTEWHRVAIFNENLVGVAERFLRKGSKVQQTIVQPGGLYFNAFGDQETALKLARGDAAVKINALGFVGLATAYDQLIFLKR